jgi:predicted porin
MKYTNKLILASMIGSATLPVMAASVDIYGRADLSIQSSDKGESNFTELKSNASRLGFKGMHSLNADLEVVYKAEFEVDMDGDGDVFKARNQYIGLRGVFGEVLLGKNDTMLKQSQGKVDLFSDLNGDIKTLWAGENRLGDSITYKSPKFQSFQLGLTYITEDEIAASDAFSMAIFYGDKKLKKSTLYASVAYDSDVKGKSGDGAVKGNFDILRATVSTKLAGVTLGLMLQNQEDVVSGVEMNGVMVSAKYSIDNLTFKGQLQTADYEDSDSRSGITAGLDYKLAKSTKLYAFYTSFDLDSSADQDYLAAGIQYNF